MSDQDIFAFPKEKPVWSQIKLLNLWYLKTVSALAVKFCPTLVSVSWYFIKLKLNTTYYFCAKGEPQKVKPVYKNFQCQIIRKYIKSKLLLFVVGLCAFNGFAIKSVADCCFVYLSNRRNFAI